MNAPLRDAAELAPDAVDSASATTAASARSSTSRPRRDDMPRRAVTRLDALDTALAPVVEALSTWLVQRLLREHGNPPVQFVLWNGQPLPRRARKVRNRITIHDPRALLRLAADPLRQFAELYEAQRISVSGELPELLEHVFRSVPHERAHAAHVSRPLARWRLARSVRHHYDLGNDFFSAWLDDQMVYTGAYFPTPTTSLEDAQTAKMEHICRKLDLRPGERVIEAGCGWGALALHMARHHGVTVKAYNISPPQLAWARERAANEGLTDRVEFIEDDYRNATGGFDAFVSVGMLEHVRPERYPEMGHLLQRLLGNEGRGLIQTIARDYPRPVHDWIDRRIFPDTCPPSLAQMMSIFEPSDFSVLDIENLRLHYGKTLEHWLQRFQAARDALGERYDSRLLRAWHLYLSGSMAAFRAGDLQLFQVHFARARSNNIPWRRHAA